jgi:hypothetical protein
LKAPVTKKPVNYINNADLLAAIVAYQKLVRKHAKAKTEPPPPPDYIGKCILQICTRLSTRYNFVDYSYRDLFVGEAIERCVMAIKTFNPKKTDKAFNYLTMVAYRAMQKVINVEKHQNYIKHKYFASTMINTGNIDGMQHDVQDNEYTTRIISEYEDKLQDKKNKEVKKA